LSGTLVGTEFTSSFKQDGTDFDASKVSQIEKGKTTKAEVVRLLGPPSGEYVHPMTASPTERALVYLYSQTKGSAFNLQFYVKTLAVSYNEGGIVTNVEYSTQGKKD
jgi:outer membrane protein assembly factor BamE (lipoprotein component of BamABCDE complex)